MTKKGRFLLVAAAVGLLVLDSPVVAQRNPETAIVAMNSFLTSWLVHDDMDATVMHFGASDRSIDLAPTYVLEFAEYNPDVVGNERQLARKHTGADGGALTLPPGVAFAYWRLLNSLWPNAGRVDVDFDDLFVVNSELIAVLDDDLKVEYIQKTPFIVFLADDRIQLDTLDAGFAAGGYGQLAETLKPSRERPVMTMIANLKYAQSKRIGPLVTFWDEDVSGVDERAWRIQALGAFPED